MNGTWRRIMPERVDLANFLYRRAMRLWHVRFGSKAASLAQTENVRFTPLSGHSYRIALVIITHEKEIRVDSAELCRISAGRIGLGPCHIRSF